MALVMAVFFLVKLGLLINSGLTRRRELDPPSDDLDAPPRNESPVPSEDGLILLSTKNGSIADVEYIRKYIIQNVSMVREEHQPKTVEIDCANHTDTVPTFYWYARGQDGGKYNSPLTCADVLRNSLCPGQTYLDDPKLKCILNAVSPYLTHNVLTENDLRMASLALEYQFYRAQHPSTYKPNYENPKIAYLVMSAQRPSSLPYAFDHIRKKAPNDTIIYSTLDYNSGRVEEFQNVMSNYPDVIRLPTRWLGNWGGISLVYMEVNAWLELLKIEGWDYIINISDSDGFIVPADVIQERVRALNGTSYIECPYASRYPNDQSKKCMTWDAAYRYKNIWIDCEACVRGLNHPALSPKYPPYADFKIKASQWKVISRSVLEKFVSSQDFWDILFSYRSSLVPDEHVYPNAAKRILPDEPFIYRTLHLKIDLKGKDYISEKIVLQSIEKGYWFVRKVRKPEEWAAVERVRDEYFAKEKRLTLAQYGQIIFNAHRRFKYLTYPELLVTKIFVKLSIIILRAPLRDVPTIRQSCGDPDHHHSGYKWLRRISRAITTI